MIATPTHYTLINKEFTTPLRTLKLIHVENNFTGVTWYGFDISTTDKVMLKFYKSDECKLVESE